MRRCRRHRRRHRRRRRRRRYRRCRRRRLPLVSSGAITFVPTTILLKTNFLISS